MSSNLASIMARIRALLSKTRENGCTEAEAALAASKAQQLLQTYQLSLSEVELAEEGIIDREIKSDPRGATAGLARAIGLYCDVKALRPGQSRVAFLGLRSDVDFADWLITSLETFVTSAALGWALDNDPTREEIDAFHKAAFLRIAQRLTALKSGQSGAANALVVTKGQLIAKDPRARNFTPHTGRWHDAPRSQWAEASGHAAGERASFARPVGQSRAGLLSRG